MEMDNNYCTYLKNVIRKGEGVKSNSEKVILFPRWKLTLEKESLKALQEKKFEDALQKLNQLLNFGVHKHEIIFGKLICLVELGRYEEAQEICEDLISQQTNEHYYHYVHMYLTILFQMSQYRLIMEFVAEELRNQTIPQQINEQVQYLYMMSKQMQAEIDREKSNECLSELKDAVKKKNYVKQWHFIEVLRKMKIIPPKIMYEYLISEEVHPVAKTAIFKWLQTMQVNTDVHVHKLEEKLTVNPIKIPHIQQTDVMIYTLHHLKYLEQEDPSLLRMLEKLLYRYLYVKYPIIPHRSEAPYIASALQIIGNMYIHEVEQTNINSNISSYIKDITTCEALYLSIIEE